MYPNPAVPLQIFPLIIVCFIEFSTPRRRSFAHADSTASITLCGMGDFRLAKMAILHDSSSASRIPQAIPCPPKGGKTWAASPIKIVRLSNHLLTTLCVNLKGRHLRISMQSFGNVISRPKCRPVASAERVIIGVKCSQNSSSAFLDPSSGQFGSANSCRHKRSS